MDIRQSEYFSQYMRSLGWTIALIGKNKLYIKAIPLIGVFGKLHRPAGTLSLKELSSVKQRYHFRELAVEPGLSTSLDSNNSLKINTTPYLPTKTIVIDVTQTLDAIFKNFAPSKQRGIRKAEKNNVVVTEGSIEDFARLKQKDYIFPLGFFMKKDLVTFFASFPKNNRCVLNAISHETIVASVLIVFFKRQAYYWQAVTTEKGKELHAPTLLVWYALKEAKKRKCEIFDFDGVYDTRFAKATERWRGFTKFKEGFGGKDVVFPKPFVV